MSALDLARSDAGDGLLFDSPFQVLGVGVRDNVSQIMEAALDPLLAVSAERAQQARLILTNPRARLGAEVGWLPGVAPGRAAQLVQALRTQADIASIQAGLPVAACANALVSGLCAVIPETAEAAVEALSDVLRTIDAIDPADLLRDINEDRALAAIPPVRSTELVAQALEAQGRLYLQAFQRYLDRLPSSMLVDVVTQLVKEATDEGQKAPGEMLDRLLDAYEGEALGFLEPEAETIRQLGDAIVAHGGGGDAHVAPSVARLIALLAGWDEVAQPLQLIRQAHGEGHALSRDLSRDVRGVAVRMMNQHNLADLAADITAALSRHFTEIADMRDVFEGDASDLEDIRQNLVDRERSEAEQTYSAKVGLRQRVLSITGREVSWDKQRFAVDEVERVRWGGTSNSVNGIPTGTTYLIAFGSSSRDCEISTRSKQVFAEFTSRLWRTCGVSIAVRMLGQLRAGEQLRVGEIEFTDDNVILNKFKFLAKAEAKVFAWRDVQIWSAGGEFYVAAQADKAFQAKASYQSHANTHVLSNVVNNAFERGIVRLSAVFD